MTKILAPTCLNCVHAQIDAGRPGDRSDPGEAASLDCGLYEQHQHYFDGLFDRQHDPALRCVHFQPVMVVNCACCGQSINQPAWHWPLWFYAINGSQPVCSDTCQKVLEQAENRALAEELEYGR
jgi:predicted nucleic acid-binding Zn ribbon protein